MENFSLTLSLPPLGRLCLTDLTEPGAPEWAPRRVTAGRSPAISRASKDLSETVAAVDTPIDYYESWQGISW